jgi:hypothetical protein
MLELAAESGCTMLSIRFESISRSTLKSVHKHVNSSETFAARRHMNESGLAGLQDSAV